MGRDRGGTSLRVLAAVPRHADLSKGGAGGADGGGSGASGSGGGSERAPLERLTLKRIGNYTTTWREWRALHRLDHMPQQLLTQLLHPGTQRVASLRHARARAPTLSVARSHTPVESHGGCVCVPAPLPPHDGVYGPLPAIPRRVCVFPLPCHPTTGSVYSRSPAIPRW
eukprot:5076546-Prymnesium_polylepis.1